MEPDKLLESRLRTLVQAYDELRRQLIPLTERLLKCEKVINQILSQKTLNNTYQPINIPSLPLSREHRPWDLYKAPK